MEPESEAGWQLLYDDDGYGYLEADDIEEQPWCNAVLMSTLCADGAKRFIQTRRFTDDPDPVIVWMRDLERKHTVHFASWRDRDPIQCVRGMPRLQHLVTATPKQGCRVFFELKSLQSAVDFKATSNRGGDWFRNGRKRWVELMRLCGVPESHLLRPTSEDRLEWLRVGSPHASSALIWLVLADGASPGPKKLASDVRNVWELIFGFACHLCGQLRFEVRTVVSSPGEVLVGPCDAEVRMTPRGEVHIFGLTPRSPSQLSLCQGLCRCKLETSSPL